MICNSQARHTKIWSAFIVLVGNHNKPLPSLGISVWKTNDPIFSLDQLYITLYNIGSGTSTPSNGKCLWDSFLVHRKWMSQTTVHSGTLLQLSEACVYEEFAGFFVQHRRERDNLLPCTVSPNTQIVLLWINDRKDNSKLYTSWMEMLSNLNCS